MKLNENYQPEKIYFSIPDFTYLYPLNRALLNLLNKYNYMFNSEVIIDTIFDSFPCIWQGGRAIVDDKFYTYNDIYDRINFFNYNGLGVRQVFTNMLLTETHLNDTIGNTILTILNDLSIKYNISNGCTVNSQILFDYIKVHYPNLHIVYSTTKEINNINEINQLTKNNLLVLSYNFNNNFELLSQLKHPENCEILCVEEGCIEHCEFRTQHNLYCSAKNLRLDMKNYPYPNCPVFRNINPIYYYNDITNKLWYISFEDIIKKYLPQHFNKFKISGRSKTPNTIINTIENYILFLVKPEYQNIIRNLLLIEVFNK